MACVSLNVADNERPSRGCKLEQDFRGCPISHGVFDISMAHNNAKAVSVMHPGTCGHYSVSSSVRRRFDRPWKAQADSTAWVRSGEVAQLLEPGADENTRD
jgi:hypothetical protein